MGNCPAPWASERRLFLSLALCCTISMGAAAQETPAYRDPSLPVEQRVGDLLPRMTLEEKVAQLLGTWQNPDSRQDQSQMFVDEKGAFLPDRAAVSIETGLG
jgi:beta-glucosidase